MNQLQAWITTWLDPQLVGAAVMHWSGRILAALAIFIVGRLLMRSLTSWATSGMRRVGFDDTLSRLLGNLLYIVLLLVLALTAFETLGVRTTTFIAIVGAAGLAVALALKDSLSNFSSGVAQHPAPEIAVQDVLPTAVTVAVRVWVQAADRGTVRSDLLERIKRSLDKYGLSIGAEHRVALPAQLIANK